MVASCLRSSLRKESEEHGKICESRQQCIICNSRPRRFGKSYAANMLAAYYSKGADSEKMFSGLRISKDDDFKKHLNKYDVLNLSW